MVKRLMVALLLFNVGYSADNCVIIGQIIDTCVKEKGSCKEKAIALKIGLEKAGIDIKSQEKIIQGCLTACINPVSWIKADFISRCEKLKKQGAKSP